MIGSLSSEREE